MFSRTPVNKIKIMREILWDFAKNQTDFEWILKGI
jgi:hypothetical protein